MNKMIKYKIKHSSINDFKSCFYEMQIVAESIFSKNNNKISLLS